MKNWMEEFSFWGFRINIATAEVLLRGLDQGDLDYREGMHPPVVEPVPVLEHRAVC